jgi:putative transcriptional regulator
MNTNRHWVRNESFIGHPVICLRLSQGRFADKFGLSVDAVRHWESGRRQPEAAARALLIVIAADPEFVMRSLDKSA